MKSKEQELNKSSECNVNVLAKKYYDVDELEEDNNTEIFFDKQYDNTYYDLMNEYEYLFDKKTMSKKQMVKLLSEKLIETNGLNTKEAYRDAKAMILNKRAVEDGDYAVIISEKDNSYYCYKRVNNIWELDTSIPSNVAVEDSELFCNINDKCLSIKNECDDEENSLYKLETQHLKEFITDLVIHLLKINVN